MILSTEDQLQDIAKRAKARRLALNLTQEELAERVGVGIATIKRFEKDGSGSIAMLVKIAFALHSEAGFDALFEPDLPASIDEIAAGQGGRQRASKTQAGG